MNLVLEVIPENALSISDRCELLEIAKFENDYNKILDFLSSRLFFSDDAWYNKMLKLLF